MQNAFYFGDNLHILRDYIPYESVDLVYLDPRFNSNATYNLLFRSPDKTKWSDAQIATFEDTWSWGEAAEETFDYIEMTQSKVGTAISSLRRILGENDMLAYLTMMTARLVELDRVLKPTGSIYLHCDPTASHYLKMMMDALFGATNFRNEINWVRSRNPKGSQHKIKRYSPSTDSLLFNSKSDRFSFHPDRVRVPLTQEQIEKKYAYQDEKGRFADGPILCSASMGPRPDRQVGG